MHATRRSNLASLRHGAGRDRRSFVLWFRVFCVIGILSAGLWCIALLQSMDKVLEGWSHDIRQEESVLTEVHGAGPPLGHRVAVTNDTTLTRKQMVFIIVGAVRTLDKTHKSIMANVVRPVCHPPHCVAHVVTHLSGTDNRPDMGNDPRGNALPSQNTTSYTMFFTGTDDYDWPRAYLRRHMVPGYDIGSDAEQLAMDTYEKEYGDPTIVPRLRLFRYGDPRRYSMWFARAWAWRYVQWLEQEERMSFDSYSFLRPDMLWFMPIPQETFSTLGSRDVLLHDRYYCAMPDTFAFLPTKEVADSYFSLEVLVRPGVACLGGPNYNKTVVEPRLKSEGIHTVNASDWCSADTLGWSEHILHRKLKAANLEIRFLLAGTAIWRPSGVILDCHSLQKKFRHPWVTHTMSDAPFVVCLLVKHGYLNSSRTDAEESTTVQLFRWHSRHNDTTCLTRQANGTLSSEPCQYPMPAEQLFAKMSTKQILGFSIALSLAGEIDLELQELEKLWVPEQVEQNFTTTGARRHRIEEKHSPSQQQ